MTPESVPLQYDLFTGSLVDNRTRAQKELDREREKPVQTLMFSQRDIAQIGVSANPRMDLSPGRLKLISEDPRTEEEIELDRLKEAQRMTSAMFPEEPETSQADPLTEVIPKSEAVLYSTSSEAEGTEDEEDEEPDEPLPPVEPPLSKYTAYHQLVTITEEQATTVSASPALLISQRISLSLAQFAAKRAGLNETEIATAILIGQVRGGLPDMPTVPEQLIAPHVLEPVKEPVIAKPPETNTEESESQKEEPEIPIVWLYHSDLIKRRPDLAEKIQSLGDYEVEALAALVGQSLEEFYWIQLNIILSLYLDHELGLHLHIPKRKEPSKIA